MILINIDKRTCFINLVKTSANRKVVSHCKMKPCMLIAIATFVVTSNGGWVDPPASMPSFFPGRMNMTWDNSFYKRLSITMLESTGADYNGSIPIVEMHFDNESDGITLISNPFRHEINVIDGKFYYCIPTILDADTMDREYVGSQPHTTLDNDIMNVRIYVIDYNDESPKWDGQDYSYYTHELLETEEWDDEGDMESASKRVLYEMQFTDADKEMTYFSIEIENPECRNALTKDVCDEILDLIEVDIPYEIVGRAFVRRAKGHLIDRDDRRLFVGESNEHKFVITIWDTNMTNSLISNVTLKIGDRNDNAPKFSPEDSLLITVRDVDVIANKSLGIVQVRDLDDPRSPNAQLSVSGSVVRDPPSSNDPDPNTMFSWKLIPHSNGVDIDVVPIVNFTGFAATYTLMLQAHDMSDEPLSTKKNYMIVVTDSEVQTKI